MPGERFQLNRRQLLAHGGSLAAAFGLGVPLAQAQAAGPQAVAAPAAEGTPGASPDTDSDAATLRFRPEGRFRIVQFNDTQDGALTDKRTIAFMERVLDDEHPDFALINGDVINGDPETWLETYQAINNVVLPMESRGIPWALTFGNHDEDSVDNGTGVYEPQIVDFLHQYRFNRNPDLIDGVYGESNGQLLVASSDSTTPAFAIWLLDSGAYAEAHELAGQSTEGLMAYDWIQPSQIEWYQRQSRSTEERFGAKVPGLMFFHIPLFEHHHMWYEEQYTSDGTERAKAIERHGVTGERNEDISSGLINSGIFNAALERGDILGMYCGHDHTNTYTGDYYGIELGYSPGTGFGTYGLRDGTWDMHTLRGARIFELDERDPRVYTSTRLVFARDLGFDMNPAAQRIDKPAAFPNYVTPTAP